MVDEPKKSLAKAKVTARSTRQEILDAYNEVISELEGQPAINVTPQRSLAQDTVRTLTDVKLQLSSQLDKLVEQLLKKLSDLQDLIKQLEAERSQLLDQHREAKTKLDAARLEAQRKFDDEQQKLAIAAQEAATQLDIARQRADEEYTYQLTLKRRSEEDMYQAERLKIEASLTEREKVLKDREAEIKAMERDLAAVDSRIQAAVEDATVKLRDELLAAHTQELKELQAAKAHADEFTKLKVSTFESTIAAQRSEIEQQKRQLESATQQLKEVAVSVIEGRASHGADKTQQSQSRPTI